MNTYGMQKLCSGIIQQAIIDYIKAIKNGNLKEQEDDLMFFYSEWFSRLSDLNPTWLVNKCKEKALSGESINFRFSRDVTNTTLYYYHYKEHEHDKPYI